MPRIVPNAASCAASIFEYIWPNYKPIGMRSENGAVIVSLQARTKGAICPKCGYKCYKVHATQLRRAQDAPIFPHTRTIIEYDARRYRCTCGCTCTDTPSFIEPRARVTNAMVLYAQQLLRLHCLSISEVSMLTGLSWPTLKKLDKEQLKYCYEHVSFNGVTNIAIDEFSVHKNHKYATVVIDNDTCKVLWVGKGKSIQCVQPFFDLLKERGVEKNIRSVACDQNAAYPAMVKNNLPNATIIYDLFHVMANWRRDVLLEAKKATQTAVAQRIRQEAQERAKETGTEVDKAVVNRAVCKALSAMKGADWVLVTPLDDLEPGRKKRHQEILETVVKDNALLAALLPLSEALRNLWREKSRSEASRSLQQIRRLLMEIARKFDFKPAKRFAMMLNRRYEGIIDAGRFGFTTNRLEGANNKIKVLKRVAYGYRDLEYFFLRIKSALPGKFAVALFDRLKDAAIINGREWRGPWNLI